MFIVCRTAFWLTEDFSSFVLELWCEEKTLEELCIALPFRYELCAQEVLRRCRDLGQLGSPEPAKSPGFLLRGALAQCLARSEPVTFDDVTPWVRRLSGQEAPKRSLKRSDQASVYTVCAANCFEQEPKIFVPVAVHGLSWPLAFQSLGRLRI